MKSSAHHQDTAPLMKILREAMLDPALSGGCPFLAELFAVIAEEEAARPLLEEIPTWKVPGLLLSAALIFQASSRSDHPLAPYLAEPHPPLDNDFRLAVRRTLNDEKSALSALASRHTYQCNPPRRMAVSLIAAATVMQGWPAACHIDIGTASGIGLLLGDVRIATGNSLPPLESSLNYPVEMRGAPLDLSSLTYPKIRESVGIDLDPPDLRDPGSRAWMRACQYPNRAELKFFDDALDLLLEKKPRIERGSALDLLPILARELPQGQPLLVTDSYVTLFMLEEERETLRSQLDAIALDRPTVWISNNTLVPAGPNPNRTTAGTGIPEELLERNRRELFGVVCITTWPNGKRTPRIAGLTHPGACWLEWLPS
jgi:hypothetical protein